MMKRRTGIEKIEKDERTKEPKEENKYKTNW